MTNFNGTQGADFVALYKSDIAPRKTALDSPESISKMLRGDDLSKRGAMPPQSDEGHDEEHGGRSGQRTGAPEQQRVPAARKKRRGAFDEAASRRIRADEDTDEDDAVPSRRDEDDDEDEARAAGRRDEAGRYQALKVLKGTFAQGPTRLGLAELCDPIQLAKVSTDRGAQHSQLAKALQSAITGLRSGTASLRDPDVQQAVALARRLVGN